MDGNRALEDLKFIRKVIEETKREVVYNGKDYIFWGILVIVGMLAMYIPIKLRLHFNYFYVWIVLIPVGWLYSFYSKRKNEKSFPKTYAGKLISSVWFAAGISMTLIGFVGTLSGNINPMSINSLLSVIMGIGYMVTGKILESKWLTNVSAGWWCGALILFFVRSEMQLLLMALMMLAFQTVPGIVIYQKYKKEMESRIDR